MTPLLVDMGANNDVTVTSGAITETNSTAILSDTASMVVDLAAIEVTQNTIAGDTTSIDGKITACNTGAVVLAAGTAAIGTVGVTSGPGSASSAATAFDSYTQVAVNLTTVQIKS